MLNKQRLIIIIVASLTIVVLLSFLFIKPKDVSKLPAPPVEQFQSDDNSTDITNQNISFDIKKRDQLVEKISNKPALSSSDQTVKRAVLAKIGNKSGYLEETPEYKTEYIKSVDLFQVEILTTDYSFAKVKATSWFKDQGFSQEGVCNLPVMFYLSAQTRSALKDKDITFNYLPEGC